MKESVEKCSGKRSLLIYLARCAQPGQHLIRPEKNLLDNRRSKTFLCENSCRLARRLQSVAATEFGATGFGLFTWVAIVLSQLVQECS